MFPLCKYTMETCFRFVKVHQKKKYNNKNMFLLYIDSYTTEACFRCTNGSGEKIAPWKHAFVV